MDISTNKVIVPPDCSVVNQSANASFCPSDEWQSIEKFLQLSHNSLPQRYTQKYGFSTPHFVQVTSKEAIRQLTIQHQTWMPFVNSDSLTMAATAEQGAVADALTATGKLWAFTFPDVNTHGHGVPLEQLDAVHLIKDNYYQPYTIASCANDTIEGPDDERPLAFPIPPGVLPQYIPRQELNNSLLKYPAFPFFNVTRAEIFNTAGPSSENRLQWIELPQDPWNGSAIGSIVQFPKQDPGVQEILVCTLGAGWGQSILNTSTRQVGSSNVRSSISDQESRTRELLSAKDTADPAIRGPRESGAETNDISSSGAFIFPIYPQRKIEVSANWAEYLNPFIPELNTTVFHQLMQINLNTRIPNEVAAIILPSLLANGLSRIGIESLFQGDLRNSTNSLGETVPDSNSWFRGKGDAFVVDPEESRNWVKLKVDTTFEGYAYNTSGVGPKVAIIFLLMYCTLAIAHTCYAGISGKLSLRHTNE